MMLGVAIWTLLAPDVGVAERVAYWVVYFTTAIPMAALVLLSAVRGVRALIGAQNKLLPLPEAGMAGLVAGWSAFRPEPGERVVGLPGIVSAGLALGCTMSAGLILAVVRIREVLT